MNPEDTKHRIERTKNRHSRALLQGDTIVIRLAKNLSSVQEREHIHHLLGRMAKHALKEREKTRIDPFRPLLEGHDTLRLELPNGRAYVFTLVPGKHTKAQRHAGGWKVTVSPTERRHTLHRLLWKLLAESEVHSMADLVHALNERTFKVRLTHVRLSYATTQWGSCSPRGHIMLNSALLFVPNHLLHYVILHELAHRHHPNHSRAYWREVARFYPEYEAARREMRRFRLLSL